MIAMLMNYKFSQHQKFLQKMALTPQMRQSIQILGMSTKDLGEYIDSIASANPFLQKLIDRKPTDRFKKSESDFNYIDQAKAAVNPRQTILSRLRMSGLSEKEIEIAEYLVFEMDDNGYITEDPEEVAEALNVGLKEVTKCIEVIQDMDPPGIGARDIRECLQLQLKRAGKEGSLEYRIVTDCTNELARNDIGAISRELKVDEVRVRQAIGNIKKLNPRPASTILAKPVERAIPELIVKVDEKKVRLELNKTSLPSLRLYNPYEHNLDIIKDPEAKKFLKENMEAARGLIDNLRRREETLCSVANYILKHQQETFSRTRQELKSLTINDVAKALDFHPSTISRAISNKYIQVNDNVVPLKSLLSGSIIKENGETTSKSAVMKMLESLVKAENAASPLSDANLEELLKQNGIAIKRRTIAKYRTALRILPAYLRKKAKK